MVDQTTNLADEFTTSLENEYPDISGPAVSESANIGNEQAAGRTLFALEDDELYNTGRRARDAYRELTTDLLDRLEAR